MVMLFLTTLKAIPHFIKLFFNNLIILRIFYPENWEVISEGRYWQCESN